MKGRLLYKRLLALQMLAASLEGILRPSHFWPTGYKFRGFHDQSSQV